MTGENLKDAPLELSITQDAELSLPLGISAHFVAEGTGLTIAQGTHVRRTNPDIECRKPKVGRKLFLGVFTDALRGAATGATRRVAQAILYTGLELGSGCLPDRILGIAKVSGSTAAS